MINYQDVSTLVLEGSGVTYIGGSRIPEPNQGSVNKEKEDNTVGRESTESHTEVEP